MNRIFNPAALAGLNLRTPEGHKKFFGAIQAYAKAESERATAFIGKIKELATASQTPEMVAGAFSKFDVGRGDVDLAWKLFFEEIPSAMLPGDNFTLVDIKNAVTFKRIGVGEKIEYQSISGSSAAVYFDTFGAGLQIPEAWYQDQKFWQIEQAVQEYNLAWYEDQATIMYALLHGTAAGGKGFVAGIPNQQGTGYPNIVYNTTESGTLAKDAATINAGVIALLNELKTLGFKVTVSTPLVLLCNINMFDRCRAALNVVRNGFYTGAQPITTNIQLATTLNLGTASTWNKSGTGTASASQIPLGYLGVPGRKSVFLNKMPLTIYPPEFKTDTFATLVAAWGRYGGALNSAQVKRLLSAD